MDFTDFFDACRSLASSAGELASLLVVGLVSYLLVVVRSLANRVKAQLSLTSSASAFARAPRASPARRVRRSSSALPGGSAATSPPPPQQEPSDGLSQVQPPPVVSPVERFLQSAAPTLVERAALGEQQGADGSDSARRSSDAERGADHAGSDDARGGEPPGLVLASKRD